MGILNFIQRNKIELSDDQKKEEKMWALWEEDLVESPYAELMTYQSEINNGGHSQYFFNIKSSGDLQREMMILESVLSEKLKSNLRKAYKAYLVLDENEMDEKAETMLEQCDDLFYENEEEINNKLKEYAMKMKL